jgi:catechol 2,3-dioxygenase-like lactoylglutathione lyase family enzyme
LTITTRPLDVPGRRLGTLLLPDELEETTVAVTGMANLAVKVSDLDAAVSFYEAAGAEVRDRMRWNNGERADVFLGPVMITLFTRAIYEESMDLPADCFLHPALFSDDLAHELEGHDVIWGPAVVEGAFGKRRIAFVNAPGGIRLEFMEQLEPPPEPRPAPPGGPS